MHYAPSKSGMHYLIGRRFLQGLYIKFYGSDAITIISFTEFLHVLQHLMLKIMHSLSFFISLNSSYNKNESH